MLLQYCLECSCKINEEAYHIADACDYISDVTGLIKIIVCVSLVHHKNNNLQQSIYFNVHISSAASQMTIINLICMEKTHLYSNINYL